MLGHWVQGSGERAGTQVNTEEPALLSVVHEVDQEGNSSPNVLLPVIHCVFLCFKEGKNTNE